MDSLAARNIVFARGLKKNPLKNTNFYYATSPKSVSVPRTMAEKDSTDKL